MVTGGAGFIGSNLVAKLLMDENDVVIIDNFSTGSERIASILRKKGAALLEGSSSLISDLTPVDAVFHLGMPSSSPMYKNNPSLLSSVASDSIAIFEYARKTGAKIIYASTSSLYNGNIPPFSEDMRIFPTDFYTEGRYWLERLAKVYYDLYGVRSVGLRLFSVYGPNERSKGKFANIASQMIWAALENKPFIIYGDGSQTRDFIFASDVVEAFILAYSSDVECDIYNVGTGKEASFNKLADIIRKLGISLNISYKENPIKNYVHRTLASTSKAEKELGFHYKVELKRGLEVILEAYSEEEPVLAYNDGGQLPLGKSFL